MDAELFGSMLVQAAQGALPWIGIGIMAGVVVFAVIFGVRKALDVIYFFSHGDFPASGSEDDWVARMEGFTADWQDSGFSVHDPEFADYIEFRESGDSHERAAHFAFSDPEDDVDWRGF